MYYRNVSLLFFCLCAVFCHLVCAQVSAILFYTMKKSGKTSKKSDSAAGTAAASSRSTSSSSKSIVSPRITTSTVSQTLTSQSGISQSSKSNIPVHRSVSGGVVAGVTEFSSSSTTLGVAGPPQEGRPDTAMFVSEGPQCMTGFSSSSATRDQGHATGLYSGIGVYPCSASLGFRGSPTPHPQEEATSQPTSSMKDLFCSFMDCVSAFNPSFAAKFAPSQACRGSIPAALGAPPPVSVSSASTPPFENLGGRAPAVSAPPPVSHAVGLQVPLAAQSRSGFDPTPSPFPRFTPPPVCFPSAFPSLSVSGTGVRVSAAHCLVLIHSLCCPVTVDLGQSTVFCLRFFGAFISPCSGSLS